jgi:hypothetical protein
MKTQLQPSIQQEVMKMQLQPSIQQEVMKMQQFDYSTEQRGEVTSSVNWGEEQ